MSEYKNMLMVYPQFPPTYWGMQYFLPLVGKKAAMPPLGLITIAAMTPDHYNIRLVDLNCETLEDEDIQWADFVCFSAMLPQKSSLFKLAARCRAAGKLTVFGGPYPTACPDECRPHCDVMVLNEGEITWREFIKDLDHGVFKDLYTTEDKPDVTQTPVPRFDLLKIDYYGIMPVQFSRGCPFLCEFCDIIVMFGRKPRTKSPEQMTREFEAIYNTGYRGAIFVVDDNFIGNKKEVRKLLPVIAEWNNQHGSPFFFGTEASVNLADEADLLANMIKANFAWVFLGLETPSPESLKETLKVQNLKGTSLSEKVAEIQKAGLQVYGGFIIGFDSDTEVIFELQKQFIREAAIPNAMIGPIVALPGTPLYARMKRTGRLIEEADGDEDRTIASGYTNIVTNIPIKRLLEGHKEILETIYTPEAYFERSLESFTRMPHPPTWWGRIKRLLWLHAFGFRNVLSKMAKKNTSVGSQASMVKDLPKVYLQIPLHYYWTSLKFAWAVFRKCPDHIPWIPHYFMMGYHYYRFTRDHVVPGLNRMIQQHQELEQAAPKSLPAA